VSKLGTPLNSTSSVRH